MSEIKNEVSINEQEILHLRAAYEHRALWLLLLCQSAEEKGLQWEDFACDAITRNGYLTGTRILAEKGDTVDDLYEGAFTPLTQKIFEMEVLAKDAEKLEINFHYCPLVNAWQKQGCSSADIARLCDIAMCGDHGIAKKFGMKLELPKLIARNDGYCALRFKKV